MFNSIFTPARAPPTVCQRKLYFLTAPCFCSHYVPWNIGMCILCNTAPLILSALLSPQTTSAEAVGDRPFLAAAISLCCRLSAASTAFSTVLSTNWLIYCVLSVTTPFVYTRRMLSALCATFTACCRLRGQLLMSVVLHT